MAEVETIRVLLVEDDEDDYILTRELLSEIPARRFHMDWAKTFEDGLKIMANNQHDICLLDYRLGAQNGVELLREARKSGCQSPVILLTTSGLHRVDMEAMGAGASDYLIKGRLDANSLERSIRYAIQRQRASTWAAFEQARLAAFGAEIGLILTRPGSLDEILNLSAKAMVKYLDANLAQIAIFDPQQKTFNVQASAGPIHDQHRLAQIPVVKLNCDQFQDGKPLFIKQLLGDEYVRNQEWVRREKLSSYAAYPLLLEDKLLGLMCIFTQRELAEEIGQEMGSVANGIALCIERKHSEEALGLSERKYRTVIESINEVIFQLDAAGNWTFLNPAWTIITGRSLKSALGKSFLQFIHPDERELNRRMFAQLTGRKIESCRYETRVLDEKERVRWVELDARVILEKDGTVGGASGSLNDITDRKLAETRIQKLAAFPRVNPNPVLEFAADGTLTYFNDATVELARALGRENVPAILPEDAVTIVRHCFTTGQRAMRKQVVIGGRTLSWSFFPVADSPVVHCYGADMTEVLNLEAQLRQSQKMECVGQLAAGVAHDINNVLTVVQGRAGLLLNSAPPGSEMEKSLKQISSASERAARFIRQLLMFSRKQVIQTKVLNVNLVIQNLENLLPRMLGEDIALEAACNREIPPIQGDMGMVEQVIMNLVVNARDAMPKGGKLVIGTSVVTIDETSAGQNAGSYPGRFVCVTVTDTGCGMSPQTLERIFEPFFTTKEVGKGTGLGLATVYGIVRQHRGWISVHSEIDCGTTFRIFLPAASQTDGSATEFIAKSKVVRGGNESILVVEDEDVLRELVQQILKEYQYQVTVAATGVEALKIWNQCEGKFDLLLTDMIMPGGMTGHDLAEELRKQKPELKVIFTSGYSSDLVGKDLGEEVFLPKPYMPPQLARVVRECLDGPASEAAPLRA
jgi:two-component system, cell cycle sensor histidine kinase and response regulator CckA